MNNGTVKFFNEAKGFGFIKDEESGKEYFVHTNGLKDRIKKTTTLPLISKKEERA